jgi:PD-(D/E)XK nuclease superfamily
MAPPSTASASRRLLSPVQRRTVSDLLDADGGRAFPSGLARELRQELEAGVAPFLPWRGVPLSLSKERLNVLARCEGLFDADLRGERPPFEHNPASAAGTLAHKSIELDVRSTQERGSGEIVQVAAHRLERDRRFRPYWEGLPEPRRVALLERSEGSVARFRSSFPPVRGFRRKSAPVTELWLETSAGGGAVMLRGKVDLLVGASRTGLATPVLIDLKDGRPSLDHAEDMRLYALLYTLRTGVPPFRVATFLLASGRVATGGRRPGGPSARAGPLPDRGPDCRPPALGR